MNWLHLKKYLQGNYQLGKNIKEKMQKKFLKVKGLAFRESADKAIVDVIPLQKLTSRKS